MFKVFLTAFFVLGAGSVHSQGWVPSYNSFGGIGLVDMPTADSAPDGEVSATLGGYDDQQRTSFSFQLTPRLSGTFRYTHIDRYWRSGGVSDTYDRSFDIHYRLLDETEYLPSVAFGLRDFMGTSLYTSEYIVATKSVGPDVRVSAGLGWGRLGTYNGFDNPFSLVHASFADRPRPVVGKGGLITTNVFFRGDAALFGGVEWQVNDALGVKLEYSSDAYVGEDSVGSLVHKSPLNFGLTYTPFPGYQLGAYYLYGSEIGLSVSVLMDPKTGAAPSGFEAAPVPVAVRPEFARAAQSWDAASTTSGSLEQQLSAALLRDGIKLIAVDVRPASIRLRYENTRHRAEAQVVGRIARVLTQLAPASVEQFILEPTQGGIALSSIALVRRDLEMLENELGAASEIRARATIAEAGGSESFVPVAAPTPALTWGIQPYLEMTVFDGDNPLLADFGVEFTARYELRPNLIVSGAARKRLGGNRSIHGTPSTSAIEPVRSNGGMYAALGDPGLEHLTLAWNGHPAHEIYTRVTAGYLERMFGGISSEVLWKPVDSRFALGAELNYVAQRDFDQGFGFQDYSVLTGHLSAYYAFENGFHTRLDVGRYLAGDWGATFSLDREFENGWSVGAYFTLTDVPFEDFGEGSFDKGIRVTVPIGWATGRPTRQQIEVDLNSLARDGGARLRVDGRLYDVVRSGHAVALDDSWGRFWR